MEDTLLLAKTRGRCVSRGRHAEQVIRPLAFVSLYTHQNCVRVNELGRLLLLLRMFCECHRKDQRQRERGMLNVVYWKIYHFHFQAINSVFWAQCDKGQMCSGWLSQKEEARAAFFCCPSVDVSLSLCWAHWNSSGREKCGIHLPGRITVAFHGRGESNLFCK